MLALAVLLSLLAMSLSGQTIFKIDCAPGRCIMPMQDCLEPEVFAEGEYILTEGEPLGSNAKFYLIESGTVMCLRTNQVQMTEAPG